MNAIAMNFSLEKKRRRIGHDDELKNEISRLKKELNRVAAEHGHRHHEVARIMAELDPLIALHMDKQFRAAMGNKA